MERVYNWHLGRDMGYRYPGAAPQRQFAAVFNINRCIGCQTCTMACKSTWTFSPGQELMWWNNVETKPYGGYPANWDVRILDLLDRANPGGQVWDGQPGEPRRSPYGVFDGKTIFEAADGVEQVALGYIPDVDAWKAPNFREDHGTPASAGGAQLPEHDSWFFYLQRICNHCSYPACLAACPRGAVYKRPEDGIVLLDQQRCRGYRKCVEACPYKKTMYRPTTRTTEKCIACYPRVEGRDPLSEGRPMETRCMSVCPGKIRLQGLVRVEPDATWTHDPKNPLYFLVHEAQVALPLYPQFGTQPNIYYIPPRWVPRPYLRQMFGPGVDRAIANYTAPSRELLAVLQLFRATRTILFSFEIRPGRKVGEFRVGDRTQEIFDDTVIGFDADGKEVVRTSVEEPIHRRPTKLNSI